MRIPRPRSISASPGPSVGGELCPTLLGIEVVTPTGYHSVLNLKERAPWSSGHCRLRVRHPVETPPGRFVVLVDPNLNYGISAPGSSCRCFFHSSTSHHHPRTRHTP